MTEITLDSYKKAYRQISIENDKKGFLAHAIAYAVINSILIAIDLMTGLFHASSLGREVIYHFKKWILC